MTTVSSESEMLADDDGIFLGVYAYVDFAIKLADDDGFLRN